jgi:UPF0755 protein
MKRNVLWAAVLIFAFVSGGLFFVHVAYVGSPQAGAGIAVTIPAGFDLPRTAEQLAEQHVVNSAFWYRLYALIDAAARRPKAGSYEIRPGTSYREIARVLALGPSRRESQVRLIEGWTVDDEIEYLREEKSIDPQTTARVIGQSVDRAPFDPVLRDEFSFLKNLPRKRSLEGYLFPETYRIWDDQLPDGLVEKQLKEFDARFGALDLAAKPAPLKTLDEVMILASIIEREVRDPADRKIVAGIFLRRLQDGIGLQSDATLSYALGSTHARATADDLALDSPYNTYKYRGLPPSPICNPGESAIRAVMDPTPSPYRFFLTDKEGKVLYASTLEEHVQNRRRAGY